jgi:G3E family GTPase
VASLTAWCDQGPDQRPQRIVLETTGLADPTDLVDLELEPSLRGRMKLAGCLTVVSALTPLDHFPHRTLLKRQVGLASLVHISKADLDPSLAVAWEGRLREAHPQLAIVQTRMGESASGSPDPWVGDLPPAPDRTLEPGSSFADTRSFTLRFDHPIDPEDLESLFLRPGEAGCQQGELLRAKGVVSFDGWPPRHDGSDRWTFQVADGRLALGPLAAPAEAPLPERVAVLIGTGLDYHAWQTALRMLERAPAGSRRKVTLQKPGQDQFP